MRISHIETAVFALSFNDLRRFFEARFAAFLSLERPSIDREPLASTVLASIERPHYRPFNERAPRLDKRVDRRLDRRALPRSRDPRRAIAAERPTPPAISRRPMIEARGRRARSSTGGERREGKRKRPAREIASRSRRRADEGEPTARAPTIVSASSSP